MVQSKPRVPMPPSHRAKQFAPFQALKGLNEAIARKEKKPAPRRYLTEDAIAEINAALKALKKGQMITVVYYCEYEQDYYQLTGAVVKVDSYWKILQVGNMSIEFCEIFEIKIHEA